MTATPLATRIAQEHAAVLQTLPGDEASRAGRRGAMEALVAQGLPSSRDENWKYANLRSLERVRFAPSVPRSEILSASDLPPLLEGYARYTFVDGLFVPQLSHPSDQAGVTVRPLPQTAAQAQNLTSDARFALLNQAFAIDGAHITAATGADCPACIELVFVASAEAQAAASYPRVRLEVAAGARVGLIERHVSLRSDANFINSAVEVTLAANAQADHYRLQQSGARATWIDTLSAAIAANAAYRLYSIQLGALAARSTMQIALQGERAEFDLHAASVADRQQVHDTYAWVEHGVPHTRSRQSFRGIAAGRSRVAFNSKVVVREAAQGTDSHQSLRGLLAGTEAEIDVRPQLEIYADDVRCAHGATAGKLDDDMLFYLLSRGIERDTAQLLLKWAFLEDAVSKIAVPALRRQIEQSLAGHMRESALEELL